MSQFYTTKQVGQQVGAPEWEIRRIVDDLQPPIARLGIQRMIPAERLEEIRQIVAARRERQRESGNG